MTAPTIALDRRGDELLVALAGRITLPFVEGLVAELSRADLQGTRRLTIDLAKVDALDSAGAWILFRHQRMARRLGMEFAFVNASPAQQALLDRMDPGEQRRALRRDEIGPLTALVIRLGEGGMAAAREARRLIGFFGLTAVTLLGTLLRPRRLRLIALASHIERIGIDAMPIIGLMGLLIGVVLAFQGADQLRPFGAELFTVNLLGVTVARELGVLLTAIMVAGRSGSAFAAELGTMKLNEEIDALTTLGIDPVEVLVVPRLLAMMIALPLLVAFANAISLLGGALMCNFVLGIGAAQFLDQLRQAVPLSYFLVGLSKAPVFAFLIAMVGCYCGLQVGSNAEAVGRMTTKAVVTGIFLVIVSDAVFSVLFSWLGI